MTWLRAHDFRAESILDGTTLPFRAEAPEGVIVHPFVHQYREYRGITVHLLNATGTGFKHYVAVPQEASYEFLDYPSPGPISLSVPRTPRFTPAWTLGPNASSGTYSRL